jgi:hypothetical protein
MSIVPMYSKNTIKVNLTLPKLPLPITFKYENDSLLYVLSMNVGLLVGPGEVSSVGTREPCGMFDIVSEFASSIDCFLEPILNIKNCFYFIFNLFLTTLKVEATY